MWCSYCNMVFSITNKVFIEKNAKENMVLEILKYSGIEFFKIMFKV